MYKRIMFYIAPYLKGGGRGDPYFLMQPADLQIILNKTDEPILPGKPAFFTPAPWFVCNPGESLFEGIILYNTII